MGSFIEASSVTCKKWRTVDGTYTGGGRPCFVSPWWKKRLALVKFCDKDASKSITGGILLCFMWRWYLKWSKGRLIWEGAVCAIHNIWISMYIGGKGWRKWALWEKWGYIFAYVYMRTYILPAGRYEHKKRGVSVLDLAKDLGGEGRREQTFVTIYYKPFISLEYRFFQKLLPISCTFSTSRKIFSSRIELKREEFLH